MEPRIQYAETEDGVSIAFWTLGEGMPFVHLAPMPVSHVQSEWRIPEFRRWYERLAQNRQLVRYDARGLGLSDRDVAEISLDAYVRDLEAVVDRLGLERFALFVVFNSGPVAIAYAARHPERVSHLILWCARAQFMEPSPRRSEEDQWERLFVETNWELYTETMVHQLVGWAEGGAAHGLAKLMRESVTREYMQAFMAAYPDLDVEAVLPELRSRTLVLHRRQVRFPGVDVARRLASRIPDARLVVVEGESMAPFSGDMESVLATIDEFLGLETATLAEPVPAAPRGGLATILFTDMESSTTLTQRLGDAKAQELVRTHNTIVRDALRAHGGSEVKHTGDGIMASFSSASQALQCAIGIQQAVAAQADTPLRVRVGLNAGEPVAEEQDLFGIAVQLARRICDHAEPGQILAPIVVRELAAGKGFLFADIGETELRGFEDPVRLYEVRWREDK